MPAVVGEEDGDWTGVCFGIWLKGGARVELETVGWRQGVGLWDLLSEGTGVTGIGEGDGAGIGVTGVMVCVGV